MGSSECGPNCWSEEQVRDRVANFCWMKEQYRGRPRSSRLVYAIIMPPCHGKTYLQGKHHRIKEADEIVHCRATAELSRLRDEAKVTGIWDNYDAAWGDEILALSSEEDTVMIPSYELGRGRFSVLGVLALSQWQFAANVEARGADYSKYRDCYDKEAAWGVELVCCNMIMDKIITEYANTIVC